MTAFRPTMMGVEMDDLIEALTIFRKYSDAQFPTGCEHDILRVYIDPADVPPSDLSRLEELGFQEDESIGDCFYSFRFGSA